MNTTYKTLSSISRKNGAPETIAKLKGMKSIAFQITPRLYQFWMILPSVEGRDCKCRLLAQVKKSGHVSHVHPSLLKIRDQILADYADKIIETL